MKLGDDEFTVVAVQSTASQQSTSYPATIKGVQDIEVRPQVSGFIVKLCVDEGATVKKGQALFQIDPTQYAAAERQAKAAVEMYVTPFGNCLGWITARLKFFTSSIFCTFG